MELVVSRGIPNLIGLYSIGYSIATNNPPHSLVVGEGLRLACMASSSKRKKKTIMTILKMNGDIQVRGQEICQDINDLTDRLKDKGDDWRK